MEKIGSLIDRSRKYSDDPFWKEFRRQLDDPVYPSVKAIRRIGTPIGILTDRDAKFLRLDNFMVTGLVVVSVVALRQAAMRMRFGEDFLSVTFVGHPEWYSKTTYREKPLVESSRVVQ